MLWDVIYEFFVKYIFGGRFNDLPYKSNLGQVYNASADRWDTIESTDVFLGSTFGYTTMPFGNYLSLIATIISMVVIVILCCLLIKKIYNICAHIIG